MMGRSAWSLLLVILAALAAGCVAAGSHPAASPTDGSAASGPAAQSSPAPPVVVSPSPDATASAGADGSPPCRIGDCGKASLVPATGPVGALVRVEAPNGYFGFWTPARWAEWCGTLALALHTDEDRAPEPGTLSPLTIVDARTATFRVPALPPGTYQPALSCSGDEAFGSPLLPEGFTVLADTSPSPAASTDVIVP